MKALAMVGRLLPCYGPRASLEKALRERDEARNDSVRLVSDVQRLVGERDRLRADLDQSTKYNACQIENVAEGMRYAGVLREALVQAQECIFFECGHPDRHACRELARVAVEGK